MDEYITELANDIAKSCPDLVETGCGNDNCVACLAFKLIGLGYQKQSNTADVVSKSEEGAECPTCHGTGRIGTTDWLTKGLSKKQLAEEKAKAIAEHEQHIKTELASEIFEEIETIVDNNTYKSYLPNSSLWSKEYKIKQIITELAELKKKYTEGR